MARETEYEEIDGTKYACQMMPATKAHAVLIRLGDTIGYPALNAIATATGGDMTSGVDDVVRVVTELLARKLTPEVANEVILMAMDGVRCEGVGEMSKQQIFDQHFRGRILHMYKVFAWSLGVNFADFFDGARSNHTVQSVLEVGGQALKVLTQTLQSGLSAAEKTESTSETLSH